MDPLDRLKECINICDQFCIIHKTKFGTMSSTLVKAPKDHIRMEEDFYLNVSYGSRPKTYLDFHFHPYGIAFHEFNAKDKQVYRFNFINEEEETVELNFEKKLNANNRKD